MAVQTKTKKLEEQLKEPAFQTFDFQRDLAVLMERHESLFKAMSRNQFAQKESNA